MKRTEVISRNPEVMNGTLVFTGTRVPVETLIHYLKDGDSLDTFLNDFPTVACKQALVYLDMTLEMANARTA